MGYCPSCNCDDCYFERNPPYGPPRPHMCGDCGERTKPGEYFWCDECKLQHWRKWRDEVRSRPLSEPSIISREAYERMMREAQE